MLVEVPWKHEEWRMAYRSLEPESQAPALGTLRRAWHLNRARVTGELAAPRRKAWTERAHEFLKGKRQ